MHGAPKGDNAGMIRRFTALSLVLGLVVAAWMTASAQTAVVIGERDVVQLTVIGVDTEMSGKQTVDDAGNIKLPLIQTVKIAGLTEDAAAAHITKLLKEYYIDPRVTVVIVERAQRFVTVVGAVRKPGKQPIREDMPTYLVEAMQTAEPLPEADTTRVSLRRSGSSQEEVFNVEQLMRSADPAGRVAVANGDVITVPLRRMMQVFVVGAVSKPGPYQIPEQGTLGEAINAAGGFSADADVTRISIRHDGADQDQIIAFESTSGSDPARATPLKSGDRVLVPTVADKVFFSVLGPVARPGTYPLVGKMRLSDAISAAGGFLPNISKPEDTRVLRAKGKDGKSEVIRVDFKKVAAGEQEDLLIEPNDKIVATDRRTMQANVASISQILSAVLTTIYLIDRVQRK